ncbi:MAG: hypothetical protein AAGA11_02840 [Pseudomonadota bacterium]
MDPTAADYGFSLVIAFLVGCLMTGLVSLWVRGRSQHQRDLLEEERLKMELGDARDALDAEREKNAALDSACQRLSERLNAPAPSATVIASSAEDTEKLRAELASVRAQLKASQTARESDRIRFANLVVHKNATIDTLQREQERLLKAHATALRDSTANAGDGQPA